MSKCHDPNYTPKPMTRPPICTPHTESQHDIASPIQLPKGYIPPSLTREVINHNPLTLQHVQGLAALQPNIPDKWDWRGKASIASPRNQEHCGSCWAFANAMCLGDRFAIKHSVVSPILSPTYLMSCANSKEWASSQGSGAYAPYNSCQCGGDAIDAGIFLYKHGCKLESCWSYSTTGKGKPYITSCISGLEGCCHNCCQSPSQKDNKYWTLFKARAPSQWIARCKQLNKESLDVKGTIADIQRNIMEYGPIVTSYVVKKDFTTWWKAGAKGIYVPDAKSPREGAHSVSLVGWGKEKQNGKEVRFWWMRNSWGMTGYKKSGYGKVIFSDEIPDNARVGYDVPNWMTIPKDKHPTPEGGAYVNGCYSIEAGNDLPLKLDPHKVDKHPKDGGGKHSKYLGNLSTGAWIGIIVAFLLIVTAIVVIVSIKNKRRRF